jgi:hypothetical protein
MQQDKDFLRLETAKQILQAKRDIIYFASKLRTLDAHEATQETKVSPFPIHKEYIKRLLALANNTNLLAIYKSRQMLVTWSMCVIVLHDFLFNPGSYTGIISIKEEHAGKVVMRVKTLYDYMPAHWKAFLPEPVWYRAKKGIIVRGVLQHPNKKPESIVQAYPSGEEQVRMETFSTIYWDEVGAAPDIDARLTYGALKPTLDGGGRLIMSSTPPMNEQHFWHQLCSGEYLQGTHNG